VNVDHVATLRQARGTDYPDPVLAAERALSNGADSITVHLREDRRHIQERDVRELLAREHPVNLEIAITEEMIRFAVANNPGDVCLVPERREELTTEGGLDVAGAQETTRDAVARLTEAGIRVALFVDPDLGQIEASAAAGAPVVELHTGRYAEVDEGARAEELARLVAAAARAVALGMEVHAGHGLHYLNTQPVAAIEDIVELNIGHAIVARAVMDGFAESVGEMRRLMDEARRTGR
jgi:pyridoxine 5-phosphate synthase